MRLFSYFKKKSYIVDSLTMNNGLVLFSNSYASFVCRMDKRENENNFKKNYVSEINVASFRFLSHCKIGSDEKKLNFENSVY